MSKEVVRGGVSRYHVSRYGWLPDLPDHRDYLYSAVRAVPMCSAPVGLGAMRTRMARSRSERVVIGQPMVAGPMPRPGRRPRSWARRPCGGRSQRSRTIRRMFLSGTLLNVATVLVGSTEKTGVGTNVQDRAIALHHLDAPWRPADVAQREGRLVRQGNLNEEVQIIRYVTARSFDGFS